MIPGLEYEPADGIGNGNDSGNDNDNVVAAANNDPSYYRSPSSQSVTSINLSSPSPVHHQYQYQQQQQQQQYPYHNDHPYNLQQLHRRRSRGHELPYPSKPAEEEDKYDKRSSSSSKASRLAKKLDIFPKTERDYTVRTERGGQLTTIGYVIMSILILAEYATWRGMNSQSLEHIVVDTSIGKRMKVNLNITFPAIHCDDVHLDVMDVAGDSHNGLDDMMMKRRLRLRDGSPIPDSEIRAVANVKAEQDKNRRELLKAEVGEDYCGPCYGARTDNEDGCCDTCDDVLAAYRKMHWNEDAVTALAEQCVREGRAKNTPKKMAGGEGCNLSGHFTVNRVGGNFHIAMGEGVDRDGRHVHNFLPEDRVNFNASHVVHELSFMDAEYGDVVAGGTGGLNDELAKVGINGERSLNGVRKFVSADTGTTGLFQYFIKVVPTRYRGEIIDDMGVSTRGKTPSPGGDDQRRILETNRYFYTERFRPLIGEVHEEAIMLGGGDAESGTAGVHVGGKYGGTLHEKMEHHDSMNAVLPGIFFVYEIYPFAVEVTRNSVPLMHLLTRIMAAVGGVFTIMSLIDGAMYSRDKKFRRSPSLQ